PPPACPATSMSSTISKADDRACRKARWSSTTSTRMVPTLSVSLRSTSRRDLLQVVFGTQIRAVEVSREPTGFASPGRRDLFLVLAQEEARMLNHNYIGTEHILLGLIHEGEGVAAKALESLNISLEAVRQQVEEIIGQGQAAPTGHIPFTPRAKKVLELSLREALQLGHNYIG